MLNTVYMLRDVLLLRNFYLLNRILSLLPFLGKRIHLYLERTKSLLFYKLHYSSNTLRHRKIDSSNVVIRQVDVNQDGRKRSRLCLFAHYDKDDIIDDYVIFLLNQIQSLDCDIVFVSTSEELSVKSIEKIKKFCLRIIVRKNFSYDFGSWKVALSSCSDLSGYESLLIMNDSVYGPLSNIATIFNRMEQSHCDIWGLTDSFDPTYHLQSYFIVFKRNVVASEFFEKFWRDVYFFEKTDKMVIVHVLEVGLTGKALRAGFRVEAFCAYTEVVAHTLDCYPDYPHRELIKNFHVNQSHFLWRVLIHDFHYPFLKIELLRDNPAQVADADRWEDLVDPASYAPQHIKKHLARVKRS